MDHGRILLVGLLLLAAPLAGCVDQGPQQPDGGTDGPSGDGDGGADGDGPGDDGDDGDDGAPMDGVDDELDDPLGGDDVDVRVKQDAGKTVYWVLPGQRELDPKVFGTPEDPTFPGAWAREQAQGPIADLLNDLPFPVGVPEDARTVEDGVYKTKAPTLFSDEAVPGVAGTLDVTSRTGNPGTRAPQGTRPTRSSWRRCSRIRPGTSTGSRSTTWSNRRCPGTAPVAAC